MGKTWQNLENKADFGDAFDEAIQKTESK